MHPLLRCCTRCAGWVTRAAARTRFGVKRVGTSDGWHEMSGQGNAGRSRRRRPFRAVIGAGLSAALVISGLGMAPAAAAEPPDGVPGGLQLVKEDLEFILKQIKIAEASPDGKPQLGTGDGQVISYLAGSGLRTVTGIHNNLLPDLETYGAADEPFPRLLTPSFKAAGPSCIPGTSGTTDYAWTDNRVVCDSGPRTVSNLIVDQTIDNPAAVEAATRQGTEGELIDVDDDPVVERNVGLFIPNTAPDTGLSARFNAWFTLFGQFFDHGLDLVSKGGNGTVIVPLQPDDPLYRDPAGPDETPGTADDVPHELHGADAGHERGARRPGAQEPHDPVRRPEPDLHLASLAPGLPA